MSDAAFVGFLISTVGWVTGIAAVKFSKADSHPVSLIAWAAYAHGVIFVVRPFYIWNYGNGVNLFSQRPVGDDYVWACSLAALGWLAMCGGYAFSGGRFASRHADTAGSQAGVRATSLAGLPKMNDRLRSGAGPLLVGVVLIGVLLYSQFIVTLGVDGYFAVLSGGRSVELTGALGEVSGYFTSGLQLVLGAVLLLLVDDAARGRRARVVLWVFILVAAILPQLASGSRSVFVPILVALVVVLYRSKPSFFKPLRVGLGVIAAFILVIILPRVMRSSGAASDASFGDDLRTAVSPEELVTNFVGSFDTAMVDAFEQQVKSSGTQGLEPELGRTYVSLVTSFIPRDLWEGKPQAVDQLLNQALFPVTAERGIGFSFGFYSEPYLNFGAIGVLVISLIFGVFLGAASLWRKSDSLVKFWLYALIAAYIFPVIRGSLSFDSQRFLVSALPALLALFVATLMGANAATGRKGSEGSDRTSRLRTDR